MEFIDAFDDKSSVSRNRSRLMKSLERALRAFSISVLLLFHTGSSQAAGLALQIGGVTYDIELALTASQRQLGLMHRPELGPREGLLMVYPGAGDRRIWMKNVLIDLWVFWIDENHIVLDKQLLRPCSTQPCPIFGTRGKAKYVLELGAYAHPLQPGDRIEGLKDL